MPRWPEWCRKVGETATHPGALNVGRKLLGYLATRRETPGVQTLVKRVTLDDGTTVEASFIGDQPQVIVYAPDGQETCELYVESGLLDLGPNIASDADKRFNRGPPEFDDRPATLHFGDGVDCRQGEPGLNGKVRVNIGAKRLVSECLPKEGRSVESRLRDPAKKKAQAMLPASCWSGLMQRYVQAVYGGTALKYSGTPEALTVEGVTIRLDESWGLLELSGKLRFVQIGDGGNATFYEVKPKSPCFAAVLALWRTLRDSDDAAVADKVLTIGLSGCKIGGSISVTDGLPTGNRHFKKRAAWVFSRDGRKAVAVLESDGVASVYEVTFAMSTAGQVAASTSKMGSGSCFNGSGWELLVSDASPWSGGGATASGIENKDAAELHEGDSYDFPVYAYYKNKKVTVVSYAIDASQRVIPDLSACMWADDHLGLPLGYRGVAGTRIVIPPAGEPDLSQACGADLDGVAEVALGYYADEWSSVAVKHAVVQSGRLFPTATANVRGMASDCIEGSAVAEVEQSYLTIGDVMHCATIGFFERLPCEFVNSTETGSNCSNFSNSGSVTPPVPDGCMASFHEFSPASAPVRYEYAPIEIKAGFFRGRLSLAATPILSLVFGATDGFVCTDYLFFGGMGGHAGITTWANKSFAKHAVRGSSGAFHSITTGWCLDGSNFTIDQTFEWDIPPPEATGPAVITPLVTFEQNGEILSYTKTPIEHRTYHVFQKSARGHETGRIICAGTSVEELVVERDCAIVSDDSPADATPFDPDGISVDTCAIYRHAGLFAIEDQHIETEFADGSRAWALQPSKQSWLLDGFAYVGANSALDARIDPMLLLERGNSTSMDRQNITGGYPKVSTPSFVGWA